MFWLRNKKIIFLVRTLMKYMYIRFFMENLTLSNLLNKFRKSDKMRDWQSILLLLVKVLRGTFL